MIDKNPKIFKASPSKKRPSRPEFNWRALFKIIATVAILAFFIYLIFYSQFFNISQLTVKGTKLVDETTLKEAALSEISDEVNIWRFDDYRLEKKLKETFPIISRVSVQKGIPDTLRIIVEERHPRLIWQTEGKKYLLDKKGIIFSDYESYQKKDKKLLNNLVLIKDKSNIPVDLNQKIVTADWVDFVNKIDRLLLEKLDIPVKRFAIKDTAFDLFCLTNDYKIVFDTNRSAGEQIKYLKTALKSIEKKKLSYLDLRIKGWAYYK